MSVISKRKYPTQEKAPTLLVDSPLIKKRKGILFRFLSIV